MTEDTQSLSIIAYYLSKYDMDAVKELGFTTRSHALSNLSAHFDHPNEYLKLRRDEFDVVTGSHRAGFRNRPVAQSVKALALLLDNYSYNELTIMVKDLIARKSKSFTPAVYEPSQESTIEDVLNGYIEEARLDERTKTCYQRVYNAKSLEKLKKHYRYCCQICGSNVGAEYNIDIADIHHLIPFVKTQDNSINNLIVVCPSHHRLIHKLKAEFDRETKTFKTKDGYIIPLCLNDHL